MADDEKSKNQILQALIALSHAHTLYQARAAARRTTSLTLPRSAAGDDDAARTGDDDAAGAVQAKAPRPLFRRLSLMSPFGSRSKQDKHGKDDDSDNGEDDDDDIGNAAQLKRQSFAGMQSVAYLFSVEVVAAQGLPPSLNGLLLAVAVRPKETRDGALQTVPARVRKGAADFNETLYVRCHLYCSGGGGTGKPLKFEPRPFLLSVFAVDAPELDLGQRCMDFSAFVKEFTDKRQQGLCPLQWDATFPLAGKSKGGDLVVKLAFQIMEGLGLVVNSQPDAAEKTTNASWSSSFARKISKSSFIIMSPKMSRSKLSFMPKMGASTPDLKDIDNFKLNEPAPVAEIKVSAAMTKQKKMEHKLEEFKVDQLNDVAELEPAVVKEDEKKEKPKPKLEREEDERKESEHKLEEVKVEQLKEMVEPEPAVDKEDEEEEKPEHELELEEAKEEAEQKESEHKPEEIKMEQLKEMAELEPVVEKENEEEEKLEHEMEPKVAREEDEKKELEHKPEEVKVEQLKEMAELELVVVMEKEEEEKLKHKMEPAKAKEEDEKKELEDKPEEVKVEQLKDMAELKSMTVKKHEEEEKPEHKIEVEEAREEDELKKSENKLEEVQVEQLKMMVEPEPLVVKEDEEEYKIEHELEPKEAKEEHEQKESKPVTEVKENKSNDLEMLEFDVVDKNIKDQEEDKVIKPLEVMVLGTMSHTVSVLEMEPEMEDGKFVDLELPEFDVVDNVIERHDVVEAEKALEAMMLNLVSDEDIESVEQLEPNSDVVTGESQQPLEANKEEVTREANKEKVTEDSLQPSNANKKEVARESLQLLDDNEEEEIRESLQPSKNDKEEVTGKSLQSQDASGEEVTEESLQLLEANRKEVTRESLQVSKQREVKSAATKSPPRQIRWHTLSIIIAPVAVIVGKAFAGRKQLLNLGLELRCHMVSQPNQGPHHHYVQHLLQCDMQCSVPNH